MFQRFFSPAHKSEKIVLLKRQQNRPLTPAEQTAVEKYNDRDIRQAMLAQNKRQRECALCFTEVDINIRPASDAEPDPREGCTHACLTRFHAECLQRWHGYADLAMVFSELNASCPVCYPPAPYKD